jgi:hypothetical protein
VATATQAWAVVIPLIALFFVAREAEKSALGCVRWLDDSDDFERETPIWRALLVLAAFQSTSSLTDRLLEMSEVDAAYRAMIESGASSLVLVLMTLQSRRERPPLTWLPMRAWTIALGLVAAPLGLLLHADRFAIALTPIPEQVFFCGWLLPCIEGEVTSFRRYLAPLLGAFAFAAAHPIAQFGPMFALGLVTSALFFRTRALLPSVIAHVAFAIVAGR